MEALFQSSIILRGILFPSLSRKEDDLRSGYVTGVDDEVEFGIHGYGEDEGELPLQEGPKRVMRQIQGAPDNVLTSQRSAGKPKNRNYCSAKN
ncbi:MAG: hypothetical protein ACUVTL_05300 [Thermoproteota archaeon]